MTANAQDLGPLSPPPHTAQHLATMARLHREGLRPHRPPRRVTGAPAMTTEELIAPRKDLQMEGLSSVPLRRYRGPSVLP
jgi:hypothetical protein